MNKKIILGTAGLSLCLLLTGCGESNEASTISNLNNHLDRVTNTISTVKDINNSDIIIPEFMNAPQKNDTYSQTKTLPTRTEITRGNQTSNRIYRYVVPNIERMTTTNSLTNDSFSNYVNKLSSLYNSVNTTCNLNDSINYLKTQIETKVENLKLLTAKDLHISKNNLKAINELLDNISINSSRINMTKNEINNLVKECEKCKNTYSTNSEVLNAKYIKLQNALDSRLSYYENVLCCLEQIECILNECNEIKTPIENNTTQENITNQNSNVNQNNNVNQNTDANKSIKNIDTYNPNQNINNVNPINNGVNNNTYNNGFNNGINNGTVNNGFNNGVNNGINNPTYNNGLNNPNYNNGINNGINNGTFNPNRNTDTFYPNNKNIDTYRPNGYNNTVNNGINNGVNNGVNNGIKTPIENKGVNSTTLNQTDNEKKITMISAEDKTQDEIKDKSKSEEFKEIENKESTMNRVTENKTHNSNTNLTNKTSNNTVNHNPNSYGNQNKSNSITQSNKINENKTTPQTNQATKINDTTKQNSTKTTLEKKVPDHRTLENKTTNKPLASKKL